MQVTNENLEENIKTEISENEGSRNPISEFKGLHFLFANLKTISFCCEKQSYDPILLFWAVIIYHI